MSAVRRRVYFRIFPFNRLSLPLLMAIWENDGWDSEFELILLENADFSRFPLKKEDVIVYSFMTPHLPLVEAEVRELKMLVPAGKRPLLVAGGPHVTGEQELAAACGFDWLLAGEGETLMPLLAEMLAAGISNDQRVVKTEPCRDWFRYLPVSRFFSSLPPLEITRGCAWKCRYCQTGGRSPLHRPLERIQAFMSEARRRRFKRITFVASSAMEYGSAIPGKPDIGKLEEFLESARSAGFSFVEYGIFPSEIRPGTLNDHTAVLLKRHVSNRSLTIGAQAGNDRQLDFLGRGHTCDDVEAAVAAANGAGFRVNLDFIVALPGETPEMRRFNLEFMSRLWKRYRLKVHLHHFFPLAGSEFAFRMPSFLSEPERESLLDLHHRGMATDWWVEGEKTVQSFFAWLKGSHPFYFRNYF